MMIGMLIFKELDKHSKKVKILKDDDFLITINIYLSINPIYY